MLSEYPSGAVARIVDSAPNPSALRAHGLQLLAARLQREADWPVSDELLAAERAAAVASLAAPIVLNRVRAVASGPVVLIKGPELAARYPDPALRPLGDLDLLVVDPAATHRALLAAGFVIDPSNAAARPHHHPPLRWPGLPLPVELHHAVRSPAWVRMPSLDDLLALAVPSATGVDGISTLPPDYHALIVAAHAWAHGPFGRVLDLVDVAVLLDEIDRDRAAALAQSWAMHRLWSATVSVTEALLLAGTPPHPALRFGARRLWTARERTVIEIHLAYWLSGLAAPTPAAAARAAWTATTRDLSPRPGEAWRTKSTRSIRAARNAFRLQSEHLR